MASQASRQLMRGLRMIRPQELAKDIVVVDGASCSGKSLISPLISTLDRGELWLTDHLFEYVCAMEAYGRIRPDAAKALVRLYADFDLYNLRISRYTNLKATDITSAQRNLLGPRHAKRLLAKDGDVVVRGIRKDRPILVLMTHYILHFSKLLSEAYGERLKRYVLTVRHPAWLVDHWHAGRWDRRVGTDPREFQMCVQVGGLTVPWYAAEWAGEYVRLNPLEQTIRVIDHFERRFADRARRMDRRERERFTVIAYERFVEDPRAVVEALAMQLHSRPTALTRRMLRRLSLPRRDEGSKLVPQKRKIDELMHRAKVRLPYRRMMERLSSVYEKAYL